MLEAWNFLTRRPELIGQWTLEHLWIVLIANGIAALIGVTLGIYISGRGREQLADTLLYLAGIIMTVPGLALLGLLMALLAAMDLRSIGLLPALIALVLYGQLPILRNTYTAIQEVDPAMIEAGRGMGMSPRQVLWRIRIPLAVPVMMAGLRNAIVINIGIAAEAALVGAGGLGRAIFRGLRTGRMDLIIVGAIAVSILALVVDGLLAMVEKGVTPKGIKVKR